jgi:hypothetical protein
LRLCRPSKGRRTRSGVEARHPEHQSSPTVPTKNRDHRKTVLFDVTYRNGDLGRHPGGVDGYVLLCKEVVGPFGINYFNPAEETPQKTAIRQIPQ